MAMPIDLFFVRHGQSIGNLVHQLMRSRDMSLFTEEFRALHTSDWRLTAKGVSQAKIAGEWIRNNIGTDFFRCYVSSYVRAMETAFHLNLPQARWYQEMYLRERDYGILDRLSSEERQEQYGVYLSAREIDPFYWTPPGGESIATLIQRLNMVLNTIYRECADKRVILVCHGEVMWGFRVRIERMPPDEYKRLDKSTNSFDSIHNCQILHYSRRNPHTNEIEPYLNWLRSICPTDLTRSSNEWQKIIRPVYSNQDLKTAIEKIPNLEKG